jgi:hypothetical protein
VAALRSLSLRDEALLLEACASVGISEGRSTREMMTMLISTYHFDGHHGSLAGWVMESS